MERTHFEEEHDMYRKAFRTFIEREMEPHRERWEDEGFVDHEVVE